MKQKAGSKSVSIAAPASYWYLKAFPIDRIANVIDYIVYMTYDLHGQWDYGNPNAYDACPSGRCIRSHVNLTETRNALSIVTKAGVPNNKIFVGESSYGRSFHMASDGCWGPMCEFTGSRTKSDAQPGRCTGEGGYIGLAEINEIIQEAEAVERFHDDESNSDILLYKGDYISYMTPITKDTRREDWKKFNFAGSIDWAVDLQSFGSTDFNAPPNNGAAGSQGCVSGEDSTVNSGDICEFSCKFDFCPESLCECTRRGTISALPSEVPGMDEIIAWDRQNVDLNRLCKFTCKHGYCPSDVCELPVVDEELEGGLMYDPTDPAQMDYDAIRQGNLKNCRVYQDTSIQKDAQFQCEPTCRQAVKDAQAAGRTTNYGCVGHFPGSKPSDPIPWENRPDLHEVSAPGKCSCDNWLVNELADNIIDALPVIAQVC